MSNPEYYLPVGELDFFSKLKYDLLLTVAPRSFNSFGSQRGFIREHDKFALSLFCKLCSTLEIQRKRLVYFGRSEFGVSQSAHLHILYSLDKCRGHHRYQNIKNSLQSAVRSSLKEIFLISGFLKGSFDIHCTSTGVSHSHGASLSTYICKAGYAPFRDDEIQNFVVPEKYIEKKFIEEVRKRACLDMDVEDPVANTVWQACVRHGCWKDVMPQKA